MCTSPYTLLELKTAELTVAFMPGSAFLAIRRLFSLLLNFTTIFSVVSHLAIDDSPAFVIFTLNLADSDVESY